MEKPLKFQRKKRKNTSFFTPTTNQRKNNSLIANVAEPGIDTHVSHETKSSSPSFCYHRENADEATAEGVRGTREVYNLDLSIHLPDDKLYKLIESLSTLTARVTHYIVFLLQYVVNSSLKMSLKSFTIRTFKIE